LVVVNVTTAMVEVPMEQDGDMPEPRTSALVELVEAVLDDVRAGQPSADPDRDTPTVLVEALALLRELRERMAAWEPELITAARAAGVSWVQLAPALGVTSRQAAERRYLRLRPTHTGEATGEARVQATRGQRAGDRAITHWARTNAATLRRLAGQVSALPDLDAAARHQADQVHTALAGDDAATLLAPLTQVRAHLSADHPGLAAQITAMAEDAEQQRRTTLDQRHSP
jgi:hypothetical protein